MLWEAATTAGSDCGEAMHDKRATHQEHLMTEMYANGSLKMLVAFSNTLLAAAHELIDEYFCSQL